MIFNSGLLLIILPSLANAETSSRLRGNKNKDRRQLQPTYFYGDGSSSGNVNIDHLGGGSGGNSNDALLNGNGNLNDLIGGGGSGYGGNIDIIIQNGNGPTIIGEAPNNGGGGDGGGVGGGGTTPSIPGMPEIDTSNLPGLPDGFVPPNLGDLNNLPDNFDLDSLPDNIKDQIPDELTDSLTNITNSISNITDSISNITNSISNITDAVPDEFVDTISDITGVDGTGANNPSDVCESLQDLTPEELQQLLDTLNYTIPDNFTIPENLTMPENFGENFTETYENFGENFTETYLENFTAPENYTLPEGYNNYTLPGGIPDNLQGGLPSNLQPGQNGQGIPENIQNGLPPNLQPGANPGQQLPTRPDDLSQFTFAQQLVLTGQFPCPTNGTFAPGTTLPPAVTDAIESVLANRTLPPIVSQPDRCSGMSMGNVTLLINAMPDINDGLDCALNYFHSLGAEQERGSLKGMLNGEYSGNMKFYHGSRRQFLLAKSLYAGMTCDLGSTCTLNNRNVGGGGIGGGGNGVGGIGGGMAPPQGDVTYRARCPTDSSYSFFDQHPCLMVDYSTTRDGRIFYVRRINDGRFVTLAKPGRNGNIQEFSSLIDKTLANEVIDQVSATAQQAATAPGAGATPNSATGPSN